MIFDAPIDFSAAMRWITDKIVTPTAQGSAEIASTWSQDARALAIFSARTTLAEYLEEVQVALQDLLDGKINEATATQRLQEWCDRFGYNPQDHFGTEADKNIPPAPADSLRDLSSDKRIGLVIRMLAGHAQNTAYMTRGMEPDILQAYPAWEYVRTGWRRKPRGSTGMPNDPGWRERFVRSGGKLVGGRIIALKTDPVWQTWCRSDMFPDGTDDPTMPWFNTGGGFREVPRRECIALGLLKPGTRLSATPPPLLSEWFRRPDNLVLSDIRAGRAELYASAQRYLGGA